MYNEIIFELLQITTQQHHSPKNIHFCNSYSQKITVSFAKTKAKNDLRPAVSNQIKIFLL